MARNGYDNRRSQATVFVNSTFILTEFKRNLSKGFYGDKELEKLTRKIILELWRRNPELLEDISTMTAKKYGDFVKKKYGTVNFRKKLNQQYNERIARKMKEENDKMMLELGVKINEDNEDFLNEC